MAAAIGGVARGIANGAGEMAPKMAGLIAIAGESTLASA